MCQEKKEVDSLFIENYVDATTQVLKEYAETKNITKRLIFVANININNFKKITMKKSRKMEWKSATEYIKRQSKRLTGHGKKLGT